MLRELWETYQAGKTYAEIEVLAARLIAENDRLRLENARLRTENRNLRRRLADADLRMLRRAQIDANMLVLMYLAYSPTSRSSALGYGISRRRWAWARALLKRAGCMDHRGGWVDYDLDAFEQALTGAVGIIETLGIDALKLALPRNGYSGKHLPRPVTRPGERQVTRGDQNVTNQRGQGGARRSPLSSL